MKFLLLLTLILVPVKRPPVGIHPITVIVKKDFYIGGNFFYIEGLTPDGKKVIVPYYKHLCDKEPWWGDQHICWSNSRVNSEKIIIDIKDPVWWHVKINGKSRFDHFRDNFGRKKKWK